MPSQEIFSDIQTHWAKTCILALAQRKFLNGYPDGTFRPDAPVSRVEFAALLSRVFPDVALVRNAIVFTDVPATYWGNPVIQFATRAGFLSGYPDRTFKPDEAIPRVQAIAALASGLKYSVSATPLQVVQQYFDDAGDIPNYALGAVAAAVSAGIIVSYPHVRQFKPNQNTARGELTAFIVQALIKAWQISPVLPYVAGNPISRGSRSAFGTVAAEVNNFQLKIARQGLNVHDNILPLPPSLFPPVRDGGKISIVPHSQGEIETASVQGEAETSVDSPVQGEAETSLDSPVQGEVETPLSPPYQGWIGEVGVLVLDLDKDGEPEIIVDLCDRAHNVTSLIYSYQPNSKQYVAIAHNWGAVAYQLQDINSDGIWEFVSGQGAFDIFSQNPLDSAVPIEIWRVQQGQWVNVTPMQLDLVRDRANLLLQEYRNRQILQKDVKAILAAYLACQYLLNKKREGWYLVRQGYQGSDNKEYLAAVIDALITHHYLTVDFLIQPQFDAIESFAEGLAPIKSNGAWGYCDYSGNQLIPPQFVAVASFKQGKAWVRTGNKYGYIDKRGVFMINPQFEATGASFSEGFLAVKIGNKWGYIDSTGNVALQLQFDGADSFSEGLAMVWIRNQYGYVDPTGNLAIPLQFDGGDAFSEGLARVWIGNKVGYINKVGTLVIQAQFDYGDSFKNGLARVSVSNKWGYIDRTGKLLTSSPVPAIIVAGIQPGYDYADPILGELIRVRKGERWGYVDKTGKLVIAPQFDKADVFQEGLAKVKIGNKYGYIDASGKIVIKPDFDAAYSFLNGMAIVKVNQKYGYVDKAGKLAIRPQFDAAYAFGEDLAVVRVGKKYGYINKLGKIAIAPQFDWADNLTEGLARVKMGDRWGYIHQTGKFVIEPQFDWVETFNQGLARVRKDGKWGYIKHPFNA